MPHLALSELIEIDEFIYQQNEQIYPHSSLWGDFNFSLNGVLEFHVERQRYLSPPNYGLWLPPETPHHSVALDQLTHYVCIRIHPSLCGPLTANIQVFSIQPFFRCLVQHILQLQKNGALNEPLNHALQVLYDQLQLAPPYSHYLPQSQHPILREVLNILGDPHLFHRSLPQLLQPFQFSERHLLRLSQQELSLSLSEWRNRAKLIYAMNQLQKGISVKQLAYQLGYQHSSSFIEFFKRHTGQTPTQMQSQ